MILNFGWFETRSDIVEAANLKGAFPSLRQFLATRKPFENDEKSFLFFISPKRLFLFRRYLNI